MNKELKFEIEDVGGINHVTLKLQRGVSVLKGRNAAGKTSAMQAVVRAQGGGGAIERRDGTERGTVTGPGVTLRVREVVRTSGEAEMELADTGPLARLIDPKLKDTDAAARERVRALVELLGLSVSDEYLRILSGGDESIFGWIKMTARENAIDDLMVVSEKIRGKAHRLAREEEEIQSKAEGQIESSAERCTMLLESLGGKLAHLDVGEATEAVEQAIRGHERDVARCEARVELEGKQGRIRETLGEAPDVEKQKTALSDAHLALEMTRKEIEACERAYQKAKHREESERFTLVSEDEKLKNLELEAEKHAASEKILSEPLEGPTRAEVEESRVERVEGSQTRLSIAVTSQAYRGEEQIKSEAERERDAAKKKATRFRGYAASLPQKLGEILASAGAPGLTVVGGRLQALRDGERHDYERRCSTGERVALALDVAATAYRGKVLPLDGVFWTALDPEHRKAFAELAEERGLYVLTEEPTGGELRVENAK